MPRNGRMARRAEDAEAARERECKIGCVRVARSRTANLPELEVMRLRQECRSWNPCCLKCFLLIFLDRPPAAHTQLRVRGGFPLRLSLTIKPAKQVQMKQVLHGFDTFVGSSERRHTILPRYPT